MKKIINLLVGVLLLTANVFGQGFSTKETSKIKEPVTWKTHVEKINDKEFYLVLNATIEDHWHLYSQYNPDGASLPMTFSSEQADSLFTLDGKALESKTHTKYNETWKKDEIFFEKKATFKQKITLLKPEIKKVTLSLFGQACINSCILVEGDHTFDLTKAKAVSKLDTDKPVDKEKKKSLLGIFLATFLAGLLVLFTPCVFPMIPMTMSFFLKQNKNKVKGKFNAFFYGFSIIAIYVLISIPFHIFESLNPNIFNSISTNVPLNIAFFIIFIVFAISFFGAFEIVLPNKLSDSADKASNSKGLIGIFFMALTLITVSFSCTGPALGLILGSVLSTDGGANALSIAMFGFGIGLALPFMLFALFPEWIKNIPKSGGWLNTVKVVFGFIELALAFKFLSNADLVVEAHLLEREVFIAIWIAVFTVMALYLFGKIKLPHDSELNHISVGRMLFGLLTLTFVIYLTPGLWGAPLKAISGFPPPLYYSESPYGVGYMKMSNNISSSSSSTQSLPKGAHLLKPFDIITFNDYDKGLAYAKKVKKPILLDFTGKACVNCRKMEAQVWTDEKVLNSLKNDFVLISLYVDFRKKLPKEEHFISEIDGKKITTIGGKWSEFQTTKYKANALPMYVILDNNENTLNGYSYYDPDIDKYYNWLKEGIEKFEK